MNESSSSNMNADFPSITGNNIIINDSSSLLQKASADKRFSKEFLIEKKSTMNIMDDERSKSCLQVNKKVNQNSAKIESFISKNRYNPTISVVFSQLNNLDQNKIQNSPENNRINRSTETLLDSKLEWD